MGLKKYSISFQMANKSETRNVGVISHNNRKFFAKNVDQNRSADNVTYIEKDLREFYHELFDDALRSYNEKMRSNRKITDYYEHIKNSKQERLFQEIIIGFGNAKEVGVGTDDWEVAKKLCDEYMLTFEKRNPNLKVFNAVMHLDEANPHLHIDFVPIATNQTRGLSTRVSMKRALTEQGFTAAHKKDNELIAWEESERSFMTEILHRHNLERDNKNNHRGHLSIAEYKAQQAELEKMKAQTEQIKANVAAAAQKNPSEITAEEAAMIQNENALMQKQIDRQREQISILSRKLGAAFIPFEFFSEEKLQFVAVELSKLNIPFIEENNALHIPDYAQKTAAAIAATFRPTKSEGVREKIKSEIDRLVYCSTDLENLLSNLRERGYEIKRGKYLAVKPTFAERFVRLKSLGEAYLPKNLEKRISDRDNFPNAVREKFKTANAVEKKIHVTIMDTVVEVKKFTLTPRKLDPKKIYTFQNDAEIDRLSQQLVTIRDFNLSSKEQIYSKAEELKRGVEEKSVKLRELSAELPVLKSDVAQLKYYFSVIDEQQLDAAEQEKLSAARKVAEKYGVKSETDISDLERRLKLLPDYVSSLKNDIFNEQLKLKRVSDLITVYENIVEGNYIDNLIRAQREQQEQTKNSPALQNPDAPKKS
ncbi:MAG: plasmid recombination protein [Lachnospiraceae bacterium]|nr:plasmid recombination protein [Ruminococcus sp.]MCM1276433.1 plasmid recombination protein [Lachnospiraceae bacterium]